MTGPGTVDAGACPAAALFPVPRVSPLDPPPEYDALRQQGALVRASFRAGNVWLVTRHAEARQVLSSDGISTDPTVPGHPFADMVGSEQEQAGQFIDMDQPRHGLYRRLLISEFSHHRARELRPRLQELAEQAAAGLARSPAADLVADFGLPFSTSVICEVLGVPYEDRSMFHDRVDRMVSGFYSDDDARTARTELYEYLRGLVRATTGGQDTLVQRLVAKSAALDAVTEDDVVGIAFLLLVAGHQTVANMIPLSVFTLLQHADQLEALLSDRSLWPAAVDELLRFLSIVDWVAFDRVATRDLVLGGIEVAAGDALFVLGASANRDGRVFQDPDVFDVRREQLPHLAFGHGIHQCLGANLARAEVETALRVLFARFPRLRSAVPIAELPFALGARTYGMRRFPVVW